MHHDYDDRITFAMVKTCYSISGVVGPNREIPGTTGVLEGRLEYVSCRQLQRFFFNI